MDVLKWLREEGCPWEEETCSEAAKGGHLNVLKYAHENGCPWNEETCMYAAEEGHLHVLKYAVKHRCSWDKASLLDLAINKKVLEWIAPQPER